MTMIYLAGPIDLVTKQESSTWREKFANELASRGMSSFNPASAFKLILDNEDDAKTLVNINTAALHQTDFVVFVMGKTIPSIGTPMELFMAHMHDIPHVVVWEPQIQSFDSKLPSSPPVVVPAYISAFAQHVVYRFDDALDYIVQETRAKSEFLKSLDSTIGVHSFK